MNKLNKRDVVEGVMHHKSIMPAVNFSSNRFRNIFASKYAKK